MPKSGFIWGAFGLVVLTMGCVGGWLFSLPASASAVPAAPVPHREAEAMLALLKPKRERPVVAVIGINDATETTDYLMPTGILRRADVAEVLMLATGPGPVQLYPALAVQPDATIAAFDAEHSGGADYVIVPAMSRDDDPEVMTWLRSQAAKGAMIIGICAGAKVVGAAGLLDGKRATTHWYYRGEMLKRSPTIRYTANRRIVADEGVATTTGITASMPMMLTLIEAIAGRAKAKAVAQDLGLERWNARHASDSFKLTRPFAMTVLSNRLAFWNRDELGVDLAPGMDEVSLALIADAWSRTYRSNVTTYAGSAAPVTSRNGLRILPDRVAAMVPAMARVLPGASRKPAEALDLTLDAIEARYGKGTAHVVALQLEYPRQSGNPAEQAHRIGAAARNVPDEV
jgi:transcriptional regulator GlxA family with amidase domain